MNADPTTDLEQRLQALAESAPPPPPSAADDLQRGRRGLARRRSAVGAAALATAAVVTVAAIGITGGAGDDAGPGPSGAPSTTATDPVTPSPSPPPDVPPPDRRNAKQLLRDWARVLDRHLDPAAGHLDTKVTGFQGGAGLGTKLGWSIPGEEGLGLVQIYVGRDAFQGSFSQFSCDRSSPPCEEVTVRGVTMRVQRADGVTSVYHQQDDGDRVFLMIDPLFGNNSLVPLDELRFGLNTLAAAVSDPGFTTPTARQVRTSSEAFGFPDPGIPGASTPPG